MFTRVFAVVALVVAVGVVASPAFADSWFGWHGEGHGDGHGEGRGDGHGKGHHGAPAPLLAAGIPAFIALGGGAAATRLARRFRGTKA